MTVTYRSEPEIHARMRIAIGSLALLALVTLLAIMQHRDEQARIEEEARRIASMKRAACKPAREGERLHQFVDTEADWQPAKRYCIYVRSIAGIRPQVRTELASSN